MMLKKKQELPPRVKKFLDCLEEMIWDHWVMFNIVLFMLVSGLFIGTTIKTTLELSYPGEICRIEQLREDMKKVDVISNEDILGQVTVYNQKIKTRQIYNSLWWSGFFIPDGWDEIEIIELKKGC